jgi:stearoyl-CoA desaturase (delta-9 desaturase)
MARYAKELKRAVAVELDRIKSQGGADSVGARHLRLAKAWLHRDDDKIPSGCCPA